MLTELKTLATMLGRQAGDGADGTLFPPPAEIFPWDFAVLVKRNAKRTPGEHEGLNR